MGWFGAGFVFFQKPDWTKLQSLPLDLSFRAFESRTAPTLWILEFWRRKRKHSDPFMDGDEIQSLRELPSAPSIDEFDKILEILRDEADVYGSGWLRLSLAVANTMNQATFFFAADDEMTDVGCIAEPGILTRIGIRLGGLDVQYDSGKWQITPRPFEEDEELQVADETFAALGLLPRVIIAEPVVGEDGQLFYENPVKLWPNESIDPKSALGLGTWHVFEHFSRDFVQVAERV